jgi:hypothetical protein
MLEENEVNIDAKPLDDFHGDIDVEENDKEVEVEKMMKWIRVGGNRRCVL